MSQPVFDEIIHSPVRLKICALLLPVAGLRFSALRDELHVADSVLSKHLKALADAGYLTLVKQIGSTRRPVTEASLTPRGRTAAQGHLASLEQLARLARGESTTAPVGKTDHA